MLQKGAINVHRVSAAGKEQVIDLFRPIESFAEATLVTERGYPADARAIEPTTVLLIPKKILSIFCEGDRSFRCGCSVP